MNIRRQTFLGVRARSRQGFTLIEILVASAVMALLVGVVITITSQVLNVWNRSSGRLSSNQDARIAMEFLTQDLETAIFRNNGLQWFLLKNEPFQGPSGTVDNTVQIRLFSPALDRPTQDTANNLIPGDICAISYELDYVNPVDGSAGGEQQFILFRRLVDSRDTFNDLMGADNGQASLDDGAWAVDKQMDFLVSNVVEFIVSIYVEDPAEANGISLLEPIVIHGGTGANIGPGTDLGRPIYADIKLKVLSAEGATILQGQGATIDIDNLIREHATTYVRRVTFMNRPF